jgi:hypothetical protein
VPPTYYFVSPSGEVHTTTSLSEFARQHDLCPIALSRISRCVRGTHKGWRHCSPDGQPIVPSDRKHRKFTLLSPTGEIVEGSNLKAFAEQHGLSRGCLMNVLAKTSALHKGWKLPVINPMATTTAPNLGQPEQIKIGDRVEFLCDVKFGDINTKAKNPDAKLAMKGECAEVCGVRDTRLALSVGGEPFDWPISLVKRISDAPGLATPALSPKKIEVVKDNTKPGVYIVDQQGSLAKVIDNLGFGFVVDWLGFGEAPVPASGKGLTYNWERDDKTIARFAIAPQELVNKFLEQKSSDEESKPKTRGEEILSEQRQQALSRLKNGCRYWDATSNRFGKFVGAQEELAQLIDDDDKTFTACPTNLHSRNLWEGLRVKRASWGNGVIARWHPYTGGWWVIWDEKPDCACQDDLLAPAIAVGDKFALNPGVTQEFEVRAISKGKKPYQIKWKHGPDETYQVSIEFFRRFKRVIENDRWNPNDFGEVPHQIEASGQATIFFDNTDEPPEPDGFDTVEEFDRAWEKWEQREALSSDKPKATEGIASTPEKFSTNQNDEQPSSMTEFKKGDKVAPAWPAGRGRRGVIERVEKNFAHIEWANGTSGKVRFDQLLLVERAKEESLPDPFWRSRFGLHPCTKPPTEDAQRDCIRCDVLAIDQQIRICQERIFQQNWRIQDLEAQPKQTKEIKKTIESAKSNIAFEERLIDSLLPQFITYCESIDSGISEDESKKMTLEIIAKIQLPEILISSPTLKNEVPEKLKFAYRQLRGRGMSHQEALEFLGPS